MKLMYHDHSEIENSELVNLSSGYPSAAKVLETALVVIATPMSRVNNSKFSSHLLCIILTQLAQYGEEG